MNWYLDLELTTTGNVYSKARRLCTKEAECLRGTPPSQGNENRIDLLWIQVNYHPRWLVGRVSPNSVD
jgi:hypothetical protein